MANLSDYTDEELERIAGVKTPGVREAVVHVESRGNPNAVSPKGAKGRMQVMDATNTDPGYGVRPAANNTPAERERVGTDYLNALINKYGLEGGLAAYNGGPGRFEKVGMDVSRMPPETRAYVPAVKAAMGRAAPVAPSDLSSMSDEELARIAGIAPTTPAAPPAAPEPPFMASVGRGIMDKAQGLKQLMLEAQGKLGIVDPDAARRYTEDVQKEINAYQSGVQGIDVGRLVGGAVADAPLMALPGGPVTSAALGGAIAGGTNFVPEGSSRVANAAIGGGLGTVLGGAAPAARAMFGNRATQTVRENVELARSLGINPRPSQYTDNAVARRFEMMLDTMPGGASALQRNTQANRVALNNAALNMFGRQGTEFTPEVVDDIYRQIDGQYAAALAGQTIRADMPFIRDLAKVRGELARLPEKLRPADVESLVRDPMFRQPMDAATYNSVRSSLGKKIADGYRSGNSQAASLLEGVQSALDDLAYRSLPPAQQGALTEARGAYRSMAVLDRAIDPNTGNISPAKLVTAATKNDPIGMKRAGGAGGQVRDVTQIARGASTIAKEPPDSGTAARMGLGWGGYPVTGTLGMMAGGPVGAAVGLGVSLPGSYLAGRAYLSPAAQRAARLLEEQAQNLGRTAPILGGAATAP